jgi:MYXO-CTERM domain-containing protein
MLRIYEVILDVVKALVDATTLDAAGQDAGPTPSLDAAGDVALDAPDARADGASQSEDPGAPDATLSSDAATPVADSGAPGADAGRPSTGAGVDSGEPSPVADSSAGCGCHTIPSKESPRTPLFAVLGLLLALRRRVAKRRQG